MADFSPYVVKVPGPTDPKFGWLSTSSNHPFRLDGKFYPTVEHYFLSKKFEGTVLEERIRTASSVSKLKILTRPRMHIFRDGDGSGAGSSGVAEKKIVYGDEKVFARGDWMVSKKFHLERAIRAKLHDNPKLEARFATIEGLKIVDEVCPDAATIWEKIRGERSALAVGAGTAAKTYSVKNPKVDLRSAVLTPAETLFLQKLATGGPGSLPKKLSYIPALPVIEKWVASLPFSRVIQSQPVYAGLVRNVQHLLFGSTLVDEAESRTRLKISILAAAVIRWLRLDADPDDVSKIFAASKTIATNELPVLYDFSPHGPSVFSLPGDEKILVSGPTTGDFFETESSIGDPDAGVTFSKKALKKVKAHIYESKPETRILGWLCERLRWLISARIFAYSVAGRHSDDFFRTLSRPESGDFFPERKIQELGTRLKPEVSPGIFSSVSKNYTFVSDSEVENPDEVSGLIDSEATISEDAFLGIFARFASSRNVEKVDPEKILSSILLPELFSKWRVFVSKNSVPKPDTSEVKKWRRKFPSPSEGRIPKSWVRTLSTAVDFFRTEAENASAWVTLSVWSPIFPPEKIRTTTSEVEDPGVTFQTPTEVEKENPDPSLKKSSSRERRRHRPSNGDSPSLLEIEDRPKPPGGEVIEISPDPTPELLEVCSANSSHPQSPVARYGFEKVWIVVIANSTSIAAPQGRLVAGKGNRSEGVTKRVYTAFPGVNVYSTPGREGAYPLGEVILSKPGDFERHRPNVATLIAEYSTGAPKKNTDSVEARKEWFSKSLGVLVERLSNDSESSEELPILVFSSLTLHPEGYSELVGNLATEKGFTIYLIPEKPTEVATKARTKKPEPTVIPVD